MIGIIDIAGIGIKRRMQREIATYPALSCDFHTAHDKVATLSGYFVASQCSQSRVNVPDCYSTERAFSPERTNGCSPTFLKPSSGQCLNKPRCLCIQTHNPKPKHAEQGQLSKAETHKLTGALESLDRTVFRSSSKVSGRRILGGELWSQLSKVRNVTRIFGEATR